ncbi:MAG: D-alanyl-D-alanine carboxypeptidase [Treponema sp.]|nr:D-alanyl-D-alanine carboxypeptidase [Treponema sp.]
MKKNILSFFLLFLPFGISAQFFHTPSLLLPYIENAPAIESRAAVLIDAATGALIFSKNPNEEIPPASLTKMMTMHLLMKEIREGRACYDELVPITVESWAQNQPPHSSLMFLEPGQIVTLREILLGLAVPSGNDAAVAAALHISPTVSDFTRLMTMEAQRMGLNVTRFADPSGFSPLSMTTADEFAFFTYQYIRIHPNSMRDFHSHTSFAFPLAANVPERNRNNVNTIVQYNRNSLLRTFPEVDGLRTGFIPASGFNIALTAKREQTRFILVLLGAHSHQIRHEDGTNLLNWALDSFKTVRITMSQLNPGSWQTQRLWKGRDNNAQIRINSEQLTMTNDQNKYEEIIFTSPVNRANRLFYEPVITERLIAPLPANHHVGYIVISDEYGELKRIELVTARAHDRGNLFRRMWHSILLFFRRSSQ